ncbi:ABC transporter permease [Salinarimonas ramus]|uniref:Membrane protein n=1 Tax=Salinarimonas ramus TaxID=690164 RepID=A0A917Q628_9HYPH|nr:ABC-2 family transporter protein [Salinarimonas ramus]GGK27953.1 membrane protein [Salinarimonas ramus]
MRDLPFLIAQTSLALQARLQNRFNFVVEQVSNLVFYVCATIGLAIIVARFGEIGGFALAEMMLVYGLNLVTYFIAGTYLWGVARTLEGLIRSGELDLVLARPIGPLTLLMARSFEPSMPVKAVGAFALCVYALLLLDEGNGPSPAIWLSVTIVGGTLIQGGVMLAFASIAFWVAGSRDLVELMIYGVRRTVDVPISVYPSPVQLVLTVAIPYAFVNYYPILGLAVSIENGATTVLASSALIVGLVSAAAGTALWRLGLRRYRTVGA